MEGRGNLRVNLHEMRSRLTRSGLKWLKASSLAAAHWSILASRSTNKSASRLAYYGTLAGRFFCFSWSSPAAGISFIWPSSAALGFSQPSRPIQSASLHTQPARPVLLEQGQDPVGLETQVLPRLQYCLSVTAPRSSAHARVTRKLQCILTVPRPPEHHRVSLPAGGFRGRGREDGPRNISRSLRSLWRSNP